MPNVILATKLYIPTPRATLVKRPALLARLDEGLAAGQRLSLICAPAGFGKTTLAAHWLAHVRERGTPVSWLSLEPADSDPPRFFAYLIAALQQISPKLGAAAAEMLGAPQPVEAGTLLTSLLNDAADIATPFMLVFDDYHLIESPPVHQAVGFLIDHAPPQMHLMILSRVDPLLNLPQLRARGQLTELREADLRFSPAETRAFLNQVLALDLSEQDIVALDGRAEGWIAGLQLAGMALKSLEARQSDGTADKSAFIRSFSGSNRYIIDYLLGEVLEQLPGDIQDFLLKTAILERLTAPLCQALTGHGDSQSMLEYLDQANLFLLPLDDERKWFRYHHLFRDLLHHRARQVFSGELRELHHRACTWLGDHGMIGAAIEHALAAQDTQRAAELVERNALGALASGEIFRLKRWLDSLPRETLRARPWLCVYQSWTALLSGQGGTLSAWLPLAEQALAGVPVQSEVDHLRGHLAAIGAFGLLQTEQVDAALEAGGQALALLPADDLVVRSFVAYTLAGAHLLVEDLASAIAAFEEASQMASACRNLHIALPALRALANMHLEMGQLDTARRTAEGAIQMATAENGRLSPVASGLLGALAFIAYERNDLDNARRYLDQAVALDERWGNPDTTLSNLVRLARVAFAMGDADQAARCLELAERLAERSSLIPGTADILLVQQVYIALSQGDLALATRLTKDIAIPAKLRYVHRYAYLALARFLLARGGFDQAQGLLARLDRWSQAVGLDGVRLQVLLLQARGLFQQRRTDQALARLLEALSLGEQSGYLRAFIDEGPLMRALLGHASEQGLSPTYVGQLLTAFGEDALEGTSDKSSGFARQGEIFIEPLSEREIEVLALIGQGFTNQEIAAQLVLSLGTVKAHTSNIYRKLDVRNRTQALARGRELGLIQ